MRELQNTSEAPSPGLEAETDTKIIKTETPLHLNLEGFFFNFLFFILFYFIYIYIYIYIHFFFHLLIFILIFILLIFYFQSSVSLMPVQLTVD
jgi:hypothetical protein